MIAFAFSLSSMLTKSFPGLCLLNACCTYATVFTSPSMLLNRSHWITAFFSSAFVMKTVEGMLSSSETKTRLKCSGQSLCCHFNQAGPVSPSLLLSSLMLIALVPMSAGLLIPLTCFHCETSVVSSISANRSATNTCCLLWELCINCNTVVESDRKLHAFVFNSWSLTICSFDLTAMTAACISSRLIGRCLIGATMHSPMTNAKQAEYSFNCQGRNATAQIVSSDASAKKWSSFLSLSFELSSTDACFSYNWKLLFPSQVFGFFARLNLFVPMLCILSPDAFQNSSQVNTKRMKQSDWVEYWRYQLQNLPLSKRCFNLLVCTSAHFLETIISNSSL